MAQEKEYFAFISYQRKDEEWADRLRSKLEHYRLPSSVRRQDASLPKEIRPIFRDALELAGGVLAKEIEAALQQSKFLIVICSPNSAKSPWVNKEIQTFIDLGREDRIIPFIIDGTPFSDNEEAECFPPALRSLKDERELLGININEMGRDAAAVKVVARMFGLKFDALWQRYEREKRKKMYWIAAGTITAFLCISGIALWMYQQKKETQQANWMMMENHARMVAEKSKDEVKKGNTYDAILALLELLPQDGSRPFVPELEEALRTAYDSLCSHRWNMRYFDKIYNYVSFADDDNRIVCGDNSTVDIYETKSLRKLMQFKKPDECCDLPFFLSHHCDSIFFMGTDNVICYQVADGKLITKMDYTDAVLDLCMDACGEMIGYQEWPWIEEWKKLKRVPDDAVVLNYNPQKHLLLYAQVIENEDFDIQNRYMLYDCRSKKIVKVLDDNGKPFSREAWRDVSCTAFSPDGNKLAIAYLYGKGKIIDLNDFSHKDFDCGNSVDCSHYSNVLTFGRNGQILHTSMYDSFKIYDASSLALVDSLPSFLSDGVFGDINSDGDVCIISDTENSIVWYLNEAGKSKEIKGNFKKLETSSIIYEDTILDNRFHIHVDEEGTLWFDDLKGEYKSWSRTDYRRYLKVKGYFQNNKYMAVNILGFRDAQYGTDIIDVVTGMTVYRFPENIYYVDQVYYNYESEQLADGDDDAPYLDRAMSFPSFDKLVILCKKATEGMQLSEKARKVFYMN